MVTRGLAPAQKDTVFRCEPCRVLGQPEDGDGEGRGPSGGADFLPPCNIWNLCGLCGKFGRPVTEPMWLLYLNRPCGNVLGLEAVCVCVCERERARVCKQDRWGTTKWSSRFGRERSYCLDSFPAEWWAFRGKPRTHAHIKGVNRTGACWLFSHYILVQGPEVVWPFLAHYFLNLVSAFLLSWQLSAGPTC